MDGDSQRELDWIIDGLPRNLIRESPAVVHQHQQKKPSTQQETSKRPTSINHNINHHSRWDGMGWDGPDIYIHIHEMILGMGWW